MYVQPIYLRAEGGRIPELKRVVVAYQNRVVMRFQCDHANIGDIALVPRPGMGDLADRNLHSITSTRVRISSHGISVGQ